MVGLASSGCCSETFCTIKTKCKLGKPAVPRHSVNRSSE